MDLPITVTTRTLNINGTKVSVALEEDFWTVLDGAAQDVEKSAPNFLKQLHGFAAPQLTPEITFATWLRVYVLRYVIIKQNLLGSNDLNMSRAVDYAPLTPALL